MFQTFASIWYFGKVVIILYFVFFFLIHHHYHRYRKPSPPTTTITIPIAQHVHLAGNHCWIPCCCLTCSENTGAAGNENITSVTNTALSDCHQSTALYYSAMFCTAPHCTAVDFTALHCSELNGTVPELIVMQRNYGTKTELQYVVKKQQHENDQNKIRFITYCQASVISKDLTKSWKR